MKKITFLFITILVLLSLAMLPAEDNPNQCPPAYPGGAGTWLLDNGACWYLHTVTEFDASPAECQACHDGTQAGEW